MKERNLFLHSRKRLLQRYGMFLTTEIHGRMVESVNRKKSKGTKISCRIYLVKFSMDGKKFYAVFDVKRQCFVTFLTKEMFVEAIEKLSTWRRKEKSRK